MSRSDRLSLRQLSFLSQSLSIHNLARAFALAHAPSRNGQTHRQTIFMSSSTAPSFLHIVRISRLNRVYICTA